MGLDSQVKNVSFLLGQEGIFHLGVLSPVFRMKKKKRDWNALHASVVFVFQVPLAQNNPYAKAACFEVAYSATVMKMNEITNCGF